MPELPEVETVRRGVAAHVGGRLIAGVDVLHPRAVRRHSAGADDFAAAPAGLVVDSVHRRGKYMWLALHPPVPTDEARAGDRLARDPPGGAGQPGGGASGGLSSRAEVVGDPCLVVHLGMSGQLLVDPPDRPAQRHLRVRIRFADGMDELRFVDQRTFGGLVVSRLVATGDAGNADVGHPDAEDRDVDQADVDQADVDQADADQADALQPDADQPDADHLVPAVVAHIARDPLDPLFDEAGWQRRARRSRSAIKRTLLDQRLVSGVGNIYADESLWRSKLNGSWAASSLSAATMRGLLASVRSVMNEALLAGGTSFDSLYVNVNGQSGYFDRSLAVYGQEGRPCPRCGTPVRRTAFMNRSSFWCPRCQRAPRSG